MTAEGVPLLFWKDEAWMVPELCLLLWDCKQVGLRSAGVAEGGLSPSRLALAAKQEIVSIACFPFVAVSLETP